jgi:DnaJ homolog subfamily C member 28
MPDKSEEQIRKAIESGEFKDLPGKGKPLNLDENPFEDPEWRMANHILKSSGFSPPWIEERKEIEADLERARQDLAAAWRSRQAVEASGRNAAEAKRVWQLGIERFRTRLDEINRRIFNYNLQTPSIQVQMLKISLEKEIDRISRDNG